MGLLDEKVTPRFILAYVFWLLFAFHDNTNRPFFVPAKTVNMEGGKQLSAYCIATSMSFVARNG
jgi:hypothetical protein